MRPPLCLWLLLPAMGCGGDKDSDADVTDQADTDTDTDTDADADADADADSDADTDTDTDADTDTAVRTDPADLSDCIATWTRDDSDDGSIEASGTLTYGADGYVAIEETTDSDAATPARVDYQRDSAGREVDWSLDFDGDGVEDEHWTKTYNDAGSDGLDGGGGDVSGFCKDTDADPACDYEERMTHDPVSGLRTLYERDIDGDGVFETQCTYTYDTSDRRIGYECTGGLVQSATYVYSAGIDYVASYDSGSNGSVESRTEKHFDSDERLVYLANDRDNDGGWDDELWTYFNPDGTIDYIDGAIHEPPAQASTYRDARSYDIDGYPTEGLLGIDVTGDGIPDVLNRTSWSWTCGP